MAKRGPKPKTPNGEPKQRYNTVYATDVLAFLRTLPNAAAWLDRVIRRAMRRR